MADDRLRQLERRYSAEPSADTLALLLATMQRNSIIRLSKQNIDLMASLGIGPVVTGFLSGPPAPTTPGIYSYRCLDGMHHLRGCWRSFPHKHPKDADRIHRCLHRTPERDGSSGPKPRVPANIGWATLPEHDLGWLATRVHKAGWRASVAVLGALYRSLYSSPDTFDPGTPNWPSRTDWRRNVERLILAASTVSRLQHPQGPDTMRAQALEMMPEDHQLADMAMSRDRRLVFTAWALQVIAKQHRLSETLARAYERSARQGSIPAYMKRALETRDRYGNRNRLFGGCSLRPIVEMLSRENAIPATDVHAIMQDAVFHLYTGHSLPRIDKT